MFTSIERTTQWTESGGMTASSNFRTGIARISDVLITLSGFYFAHLLRFDNKLFAPTEVIVMLVYTLTFYLSASAVGFYSNIRNRSLDRTVLLVGYVYIFTVSILAIISVLTHTSESFSRIWFVVGAGLSLLFVMLSRVLVYFAIKRGGIKFESKRTLVVGAGNLAKELVRRINLDRYHGNEILGYFSDTRSAESEKDDPFRNYLFLGTSAQVESVLEDHRKDGSPIDRIFVALPATDIEKKLELVNRLAATPCQIFVVPDYSLDVLSGSRVDSISGLPLIDVTHSDLRGARARIKSLIDYVLTVIGLVLISPLLLTVAIAIKIDSKGPILFKQRRYGFGGKEFMVFKFRSMSVLEDGAVITQAVKNDVRVTRLGRFLRRTSIDELPQLFNVLNGTMSLVGPRPHAVAHNEMYRKLIGGYMIRHATKPGITGWAQVNGCRGETQELKKMQKRVEYDKQYLRTWSVGLDIRILIMTLVQFFRGNGDGVY